MPRTTGCLLAAIVGLSMVSTAAAQVPDEPAPDPVPDPEQPVAADGGDLGFDQWVFGGKPAEWALEQLEKALDRDMTRYRERYELTESQVKKLRLAGRRDIKRYLDQIAEVRAEYRRANGDMNPVVARVFELQRAWKQPHNGVFGEESMLAKTLKKTLTAEQVARYEKGVYRKRVEWVAGLLHSRLVLGDDQRRRLADLVVERTPPLGRYGSFDYDAIMLQMSRLPRESLRSILDEPQCRELTLRFDQARRMESLLIAEGYLARSPAAEPKSHHEEARR